MTWTPERENLLRVLWAQGLSASQIASRLGDVTRNAVIGKRRRLGVPDRLQKKAYRSGRLCVPSKQLQAIAPKHFKPAPLPKLRAPVKSETSVRFIERRPDQCAMFCAGEDGAQGFVCGEATGNMAWCSTCRALVFLPETKRSAA